MRAMRVVAGRHRNCAPIRVATSARRRRRSRRGPVGTPGRRAPGDARRLLRARGATGCEAPSRAADRGPCRATRYRGGCGPCPLVRRTRGARGRALRAREESTRHCIRAPSRSASRGSADASADTFAHARGMRQQALSFLPGGPDDDDLTAVAGEDARVGCPCGYRHEAPARQRRARAGEMSCGRRRR